MRVPLAFLVVIGYATADKHCQGLYFNEKYYNLDIIKEGINKIDSLTLNRNDDILYFTFEQISIVPTRFVAYMDMNSKETKAIEGVRNATSVAIDQKYNKVYVGSQDGLYKINEWKLPERLPIQDDIKSLFFKDILYFINRNGEAYVFEDGSASPVRELQGVIVDKLIVDNDNNMLFSRDKELFRIKLGTRAVNVHEKISVDVLSTDIHFKPHVCARDGIYVYNKYKYALDKVANMFDLEGLTFNKANEPIYAVRDLIIKLNESPIPCFGD